MKALGKVPRKKKVAKSQLSDHTTEFEHEAHQGGAKEVEEMTELDKLYLAMAEAGIESSFNTLCYSLGITSLSALKNYAAKPYKNIMTPSEMDLIKAKIKNKHFNFHQLAQKHKRSNVVETCTVKGIPVIHKKEVSVTKSIIWGPHVGFVCEAQWTKPNGNKEKVCLRYGVNEDQLFLQEAEMANVLRHKNILAIYGVIIASSYSPSVALVVEFAEYGNLYESAESRSVEELCRFTIQAATALEHLESKKVIHQAVKSVNCLVVSKNQMKLAGLGACQYESDMKMNPAVGYNYTQKDQKDVVYQFANLFSPYFSRYQDMVTGYEIANNIKTKSLHGYICPAHFCDVFDRCLQVSPEARPSFSEIRQSLVAQKYPSKVRVTNSFIAESPDFISCKTGELILLISKDRHREDNTAWLGETQDKKIGFFRSENVEELLGYDIMDDSAVPPEIRAQGPRAELAYQKAMQHGKVEVYRGRIMLLGQARAGKTSLKKFLLGMPFNPDEESTIGIDPSKCEVELNQVKNWKLTEGKKPMEAEAVKDIARLMAKDLNEAAVNQKDLHSTDSSTDPKQMPASLERVDALPTVAESTPDITPESKSEIDIPRDNVAQSTQSNEPAVQRIQLKIDTTAPKDVTEQLLRYLKGLELEDKNKAKEVTLTLWDFAGQHLYYASHSVFLSTRAVYVLVYNLNKSLSARAEPCARQGIHEIIQNNPNDNTNLDDLLSWLVSIDSIRPTTEEAGRDLDGQEANFPYMYLRPPILIVGTHADLQSSENIKRMEECIQKSIFGTSYESHVIRPFFAVDNTNSQVDFGIQKLQKKIMDVVGQEPYMGEEVPLRWFNFEKVVEALVLKNVFHMNLGQLQTVTREVCRIDDKEEMMAMLNFYHDLGVIVKHGQTVVLQAQWLIDLFKQLITVRPFHEVNPLYSRCWYDLQKCGILRMALVDHVFKDFIQKGLIKQDILNMMELYGLIAKYSCLSSESEQEQRYFVPSQLTSSPSGLCQIHPSECDPCPLYLRFLDDFVPHGLFSLLLSRCIGWCSRKGCKEAPQLYSNGARLFIGTKIIFNLILICRKRFIKVILKRRSPRASESSSIAASTEMAVEVRAFLEGTIRGMSCELSYLRNIRYELCVACTLCLQSTDQCTKHTAVSCAHDDCLHLLPVPSEEELICVNSFCDETVKVYGLDKWFHVYKAENGEQKLEFMTLEDSASLKCGRPSTDDLLLIAHELGHSWKMFGRALHLDEPVLEQIEEDEHRLIEKCYGVLNKWLESFAPKSTYQCLAEALEQVERSDLAAKYCNACSDSFEDYKALNQSLSLKSGTPSSKELLDIATGFSSSWKMFSRALHLQEPVVAQIEEEELKLVNKCHAVLLKWSENFGSEATYQCLAEALQHPVVGQSHLVVKFCTL